MSNRDEAQAYGAAFELLAEDPTEDHKELARRLLKRAREGDFALLQMGCCEALERLGLARKVPYDHTDSAEFEWVFGESP